MKCKLDCRGIYEHNGSLISLLSPSEDDFAVMITGSHLWRLYETKSIVQSQGNQLSNKTRQLIFMKFWHKPRSRRRKKILMKTNFKKGTFDRIFHLCNNSNNKTSLRSYIQNICRKKRSCITIFSILFYRYSYVKH